MRLVCQRPSGCSSSRLHHLYCVFQGLSLLSPSSDKPHIPSEAQVILCKVWVHFNVWCLTLQRTERCERGHKRMFYVGFFKMLKIQKHIQLPVMIYQKAGFLSLSVWAVNPESESDNYSSSKMWPPVQQFIPPPSSPFAPNRPLAVCLAALELCGWTTFKKHRL